MANLHLVFSFGVSDTGCREVDVPVAAADADGAWSASVTWHVGMGKSNDHSIQLHTTTSWSSSRGGETSALRRMKPQWQEAS